MKQVTMAGYRVYSVLMAVWKILMALKSAWWNRNGLKWNRRLKLVFLERWRSDCPVEPIKMGAINVYLIGWRQLWRKPSCVVLTTLSQILKPLKKITTSLAFFISLQSAGAIWAHTWEKWILQEQSSSSQPFRQSGGQIVTFCRRRNSSPNTQNYQAIWRNSPKIVDYLIIEARASSPRIWEGGRTLLSTSDARRLLYTLLSSIEDLLQHHFCILLDPSIEDFTTASLLPTFWP